ncbi:hypothetical protein [Pararhodospirillum oryzae]|uniref:HEPN domain-containing protein n=1 Tax=Pararhodospirillum oryzae TaxID=478448 RepID=A0A512H3K9_9PROT|nr:hypothetical protein [Pararhodospirillum oryzae]GEO80013.1 hypothetical protein ROR02_01440 [Pararhodospirillum oryzae]
MMPTTPNEMITLARKLSRLEGEACRRAALHQAYYGAYHLACHEFGLDPAYEYASATHKIVIDAVKSAPPGSPRMNRLKRYLKKLRTLRVLADYNLKENISKSDVMLAVEMAEQILHSPGQRNDQNAGMDV